MSSPLSVPIVKPVDAACNLKCSYCYMKNFPFWRGKKAIMNSNILKHLIDFFCADQEAVEFIWHGGEPLLAGLDFYKRVIELQSKWIAKGKKIANFVQTNATLVTEEWLSFFSKHGFFVGVSLDGSLEIHNATRKFKNGNGSFEETMKGIELLTKTDVFNGVSCCVNSKNCHLATSTFDFFLSRGIKSIKFLRARGIDSQGNPYSWSIGHDQYINFLLDVFKRWIDIDDPEVEVRDIKSVLNLMFGGDFRECVYMGRCDQFVTVCSDGSIYACDSLPISRKLHFGNVKSRPETVLQNRNFRRFKNIVDRKRKECNNCEWFHICRGGCLLDRVPNIFSSESRNVACESLKRFFSEIKKTLTVYGLI